MSLNSDFDVVFNEGLLVGTFQVVRRELLNVTKIGQAAED